MTNKEQKLEREFKYKRMSTLQGINLKLISDKHRLIKALTRVLKELADLQVKHGDYIKSEAFKRAEKLIREVNGE